MGLFKDIVLVFIQFEDYSVQHQIFDFQYARLPYTFFPYLDFYEWKTTISWLDTQI